MTTRRVIIYLLLVLGVSASCRKSSDAPYPTVYHDPRNTTTPSNPAPGPLSYEHAFGQTHEGQNMPDSMKHYVYYVFTKDSLTQLYDFLITAISTDSASGVQLTHEDFVLTGTTKAVRQHGTVAYDGYFYRFESKEPVSKRKPSSAPVGSYAYQSTIRTKKQQITTYKGFRNTAAPLGDLWR